MMNVRGVIVGCVLCAAALYAGGAPAQTRSRSATTEEVLVVGEQPGPGLWKLSKGAHALWILGTDVPTLKGTVWRSKQVESAIAASDEVLGPYSVSLRVKDEQAYRTPRSKLKDILPRRVYERWCALRDEYVGKDADTETLLPTAAALLLQAQAYERNGLTYSDDVWRTIYRLASTHAVPVLRQDYEMGPVARRASRSRIARLNGIRYLIQTMDRLDTDIVQSRARSKAWAVGDMEALRASIATDASYAQSLAQSWPFLDADEVEQLQSSAQNKLVSALERALNRNQTTFAALPLHVIAGPNGVVARLRAAGYRVDDPQ